MSGVKVTDPDEILKKKPIMIFGKDIREITCFRASFLYGISGGIIGGLVCFMATSKISLSTHVGFASLWITVFGYWFPCRYNYERSLAVLESLKADQMDHVREMKSQR